MKANIFLIICAVLCGVLIYFAQGSFETIDYTAVVSSVSLTIPLILLLGISFPAIPRTTVVFKVISSLLFFTLLSVNIVFNFIDISQKGYMISNGLVLLIGMIILYVVTREKQ